MNFVSGCWSDWEFPGLQCGPSCDSDPTGSPGSVIWVSPRKVNKLCLSHGIKPPLTASVSVCHSIILYLPSTGAQSQDSNRYSFWHCREFIDCLEYLEMVCSGFFFCALQGSSGFLDLEGAFKYPGKARLHIMLLWLRCSYHSCPQSRGRDVESRVWREAIGPRWKITFYLFIFKETVHPKKSHQIHSSSTHL